MKSLAALMLFALATTAGFAQRNDCASLPKCEELLQANPKNSLAHYRIGEFLLERRNYQASAVSFRDAILGDGAPMWTKVWSYLNLGKIFDLTDQRERAVTHYQLAQRTKDDTRGAQAEAAKYLNSPYTEK